MKQWRMTSIKRITATNFIPRSNRDVVERLLNIFKRHIGEENKVALPQSESNGTSETLR